MSSGGIGSGRPLAISPAAAVSSRIRPRRCSSIPVSLASRLISRTPRPPLRSSGTAAAERVSSTTSTWRISSKAAPAAEASASLPVVDATTGSGAVRLCGPGSSPRSIWPTLRGNTTVSASTCRSSPAVRSRCTGRSGGVPGAASRVRPTGDRDRSLSRTSRAGASRLPIKSTNSVAGRPASSAVTCPGNQGSASAASGDTRTAASPHINARSRRSSRAAKTAARGARSPISPITASSVVAARSARSVSSASSVARERKSSSSAAAFTDCRETARAASASILPGGGWARSGRS